MTFELIGVNPDIIKALSGEGITSPTKIQKLAIPVVKSGSDVVGVSNTGSGKTLAFGVPLLERVEKNAGMQALIMAPTRELVAQIGNELMKFSRYHRRTIATVYGGVGIEPQIHKISKSEVVIGTPGRLIDHMRRGTLDYSKLKIVVIDEADKMVDMGFIKDIEMILGEMPKEKQVLLFGATISDEINNLKRKFMKNPQTIKAEPQVKEDFLQQFYYDVLPNEKFSLLVHLLKKEGMNRVIIFCSTRRSVETLTHNLKKQGIKADMIHGKLSQNQRFRIMENFNIGRTPILVASAVAARGLDIKEISHVFNYELPNDPQEYIHRIGRTARAGETGKAITLLESRDYQSFDNVLRTFRVKVEKLPREEFQKVRFDVTGFRSPGAFRGPRRFGRNTQRPSHGSRFR